MFDRNKKPGDVTPVQAMVGAQTSPPVAPAADPNAGAKAAPAPAARPAGRREASVIGPSIRIEGHLRGEEDLFIEGEVKGTVHLENHSLTIGSQGKINADVYAHTIFVEGFIEGDLYGTEQVTIRKNAKVRGNVTSPRVSLEDGAAFKGSIEMDPESVKVALGPTSSFRNSASTSSQSSSASSASLSEPAKTGVAR